MSLTQHFTVPQSGVVRITLLEELYFIESSCGDQGAS
jgi:hypothetical protein